MTTRLEKNVVAVTQVNFFPHGKREELALVAENQDKVLTEIIVKNNVSRQPLIQQKTNDNTLKPKL
jgi:hypothetical protein